MSEWKEYKLGDIVTFTSGGTPSKSNGEFWGGNIPWISASSMEGYTYADSTLKITELGLKNGSRIAPKNSILLLVRGSILHQKLQVGIVERDVAFNQDVKCLQADEEIIDPWFLLFWFKSEEKNLLNKVESTGIGAGKLDTPILKDLLIKVPPINERRKLNEFFKAIQGKIELNRQMNQTVEAMAQALFKSWFVDFDPVIDNALAQGNDIPEELQARAEKRRVIASAAKQSSQALKPLLHTNPSLAAQFPSSFVFNETLGKWIPEGWEVKKVDDITSKVTDGTHSTVQDDPNGNCFLLSCKNIKNGQILIKESDRKINYQTLQNLRKRTGLKINDILLTTVGTIGEVALVTKDPNNFEIQRSVAIIRCDEKKIRHYFLHQFVKSSFFQSEAMNRSEGSVQTCLFLGAINSVPILVPHISVIEIFHYRVEKLYEKIVSNQDQLEVLTQLRDRLLPELISGRVRVKEILDNKN